MFFYAVKNPTILGATAFRIYKVLKILLIIGMRKPGRNEKVLSHRLWEIDPIEDKQIYLRVTRE